MPAFTDFSEFFARAFEIETDVKPVVLVAETDEDYRAWTAVLSAELLLRGGGGRPVTVVPRALRHESAAEVRQLALQPVVELPEASNGSDLAPQQAWLLSPAPATPMAPPPKMTHVRSAAPHVTPLAELDSPEAAFRHAQDPAVRAAWPLALPVLTTPLRLGQNQTTPSHRPVMRLVQPQLLQHNASDA